MACGAAVRSQRRKGETFNIRPPPPRQPMEPISVAQYFQHDFATDKEPIIPALKPSRGSPVVKTVQQPAKVTQTVSAAALFKKKPASGGHGHKRRKHRHATPRVDLATDFKDGIDNARGGIETNLNNSFDQVHDTFMQRLANAKSTDKKFIESVMSVEGVLNAPLADEKIETTFTRDGKRVVEVVEIGKRIALFKRSVEKEDAKLKDYWKQWDDVQSEFIELGVEIFGEEAFAGDVEMKRKCAGGYKMEMELLDREYGAKVEELTAEIETTGAKALQNMRTSEKEQDAKSKKTNAMLLQAMLEV